MCRSCSAVFSRPPTTDPLAKPSPASGTSPSSTRWERNEYVRRFQVKPYVWNPFFPVNTLNLMRAAVAAQFEGVFEQYINAAFHHMWVEPKKMDDPEVAMKALGSSGIEAAKLFARAQQADVKAKLINDAQAAVERGAFGSPTFFVGKEMFFGKEQLREVEELISGNVGERHPHGEGEPRIYGTMRLEP